MTRSILLHTHPWSDLPLQELAQRVSEWGYQGLELACVSDHLEVQPAQSQDDYCQQKLEMLNGLELSVPVLSNRNLGQAIGDVITARHQSLLPDYVWGDGNPEGVRERAVEEMLATIRAALEMGIGIVTSCTGSSLWPAIVSGPSLSLSEMRAELETFAHHWQPVLDFCQSEGARFAFEIHPGQIAFDLVSAEMTLEALGEHDELGFTFNPAPLFWQGLDPAELIRALGDRIFHVRIQDVALRLNGRSSLLCDHLPQSDSRRGWQGRCPGHGGIDWESVIRELNAINYQGPLSVEWCDAGMDRDYGAEEAFQFVRRLDFEPGQPIQDDQPFHDS